MTDTLQSLQKVCVCQCVSLTLLPVSSIWVTFYLALFPHYFLPDIRRYLKSEKKIRQKYEYDGDVPLIEIPNSPVPNSPDGMKTTPVPVSEFDHFDNVPRVIEISNSSLGSDSSGKKLLAESKTLNNIIAGEEQHPFKISLFSLGATKEEEPETDG